MTLDADRLEKLGRYALELQSSPLEGLGTVATSELMARFRVFAEVLKATKANLSVLTRVSSDERSGSMEDAVSLWER